MLAGGGGRVIPGLPLHAAEFAQHVGLVKFRADGAEQRQRPLIAGRGRREISRQLLHQGQVGEGNRLGERVVRVAGQSQRPLVAGHGGRVIPGFLLHQPQMVERVDLTGLVAEVLVQRYGLGERGRGGLVVRGQLLQQAELVEHSRLAGQVPGQAGGAERRPVLGRSPIPVASGAQEAAHRRGDRDRVPGHGLSGEPDRGMQVGPLGVQPAGRVIRGGQLRGAAGRAARRPAAAGRGPGGDEAAGGRGDVRVVVHQPGGSGA